MNIDAHNRTAWDRQVENGNVWTRPVSPDEVAAARAGDWQVVLTPSRPVPRTWFGEISGQRILGLASAGGQQAPLFAAAGAEVTVIDNSPRQLGQDRMVATREGLRIRLELGLMADLSRFEDQSFDLVFHPIANAFVADVRPVWREAFRVLRPGGVLLAGFCNPVVYLWDWAEYDKSQQLKLRYQIPYADTTQLPVEELARRRERGEPLEFGHTLEDQIGGQLDAGFVLTAFYEDAMTDDPLGDYIRNCVATRAVRPARSQ